MTDAPTIPLDRPLIDATAAHVRETMLGDGSHDWWHVERVWTNARTIAAHEQAAGREVEALVVELAALLHDIADWKFHGGDDEAGPRATREWLRSQAVNDATVERVADIVARVSFKGARVADDMPSLEGRIVQDADRLDAIGAIGIGRAFAYGGHAGRPLHDPADVVELHDEPEAYKQRTGGGTISHFHEKLLLLADRMHTPSARALAAERHRFMETFLAQFDAEWHGRA